MRKFKLRDQVAKRMRSLDSISSDIQKNTNPSSAEEKVSDTVTAEVRPDTLHVIHRTDIGLIRKSNQDAVICKNGLYGVADGMGGHNGGEIASANARDGMIREISQLLPSKENLEAAIRNVNIQLWEMQLQDTSLSGMGTTLTVLWPNEKEMLIGHIGDSRAYLMRNGKIQQITDDHSMVADMVRRGILTEEQAACHPMRNYITRAVGTESGIKADILTIPRQKGDRWLICSDGLHGAVSRERLQELMAIDNLNEAADQMIREALDQGGRDNITLVIVEDFSNNVLKEEPPETEMISENKDLSSEKTASNTVTTAKEAAE